MNKKSKYTFDELAEAIVPGKPGKKAQQEVSDFIAEYKKKRKSHSRSKSNQLRPAR